MTVDAQRPVLSGSSSAQDALSAWLIRSGAPVIDRDGAFRGLPAGPGLSALDMAVACLCLADADGIPLAAPAGRDRE